MCIHHAHMQLQVLVQRVPISNAGPQVEYLGTRMHICIMMHIGPRELCPGGASTCVDSVQVIPSMNALAGVTRSSGHLKCFQMSMILTWAVALPESFSTALFKSIPNVSGTSRVAPVQFLSNVGN